MKMKTFEMLDGYEKEYEGMLKAGLTALIDQKGKAGVTFKEDNLIYQLKTHLGIKVDLLSQSAASAPKVKEVTEYQM